MQYLYVLCIYRDLLTLIRTLHEQHPPLRLMDHGCTKKLELGYTVWAVPDGQEPPAGIDTSVLASRLDAMRAVVDFTLVVDVPVPSVSGNEECVNGRRGGLFLLPSR